jgi:glycosyltransferase involved in cell wall biosynthesis
MPRVVSVLHHPIPPLRPGRLAEEDGLGWHFRSARALAKYGGYEAIAVRPGINRENTIKVIDNVTVVLTPSINLSPSQRIWKWSHVSTALAELVRDAVKHGFIPYIHEYRALNSELVIRRIIDYPMILQHHGSYPPSGLNLRNPLSLIKEFSKRRRDYYLKKVRGVFFVLNEREKHYLEEILNVNVKVIVRTMAVDFNELKPLSEEEKINVKKNIGISEDAVVLRTYTGIFGEEIGSAKGAHYLINIWRNLRSKFRNKIVMIVTGIGEPYLTVLRKIGILAYKILPHEDYTKLLAATDIYFLPATSGYSYGGISVAVMEALAMGIPVVSPTLRDFPEQDRVKDLGVMTRYVDDEEALREFIDALTYVIENRGQYKPWAIRELARKYYSWESFVNEFNNAVKNL